MLILFTCLITLQLLIILTHDLVDIPGLVSGSQVQLQLGRRKVWIATLVNSIFPGIAVGFAFYFWDKPKPGYVPTYWLIYCGISLFSAVVMWYVPYLWGGSEKQRAEYEAMYAGTRHILPDRHGNPRPNLFHVGIHLLFLANLSLAILLKMRGA